MKLFQKIKKTFSSNNLAQEEQKEGKEGEIWGSLHHDAYRIRYNGNSIVVKGEDRGLCAFGVPWTKGQCSPSSSSADIMHDSVGSLHSSIAPSPASSTRTSSSNAISEITPASPSTNATPMTPSAHVFNHRPVPASLTLGGGDASVSGSSAASAPTFSVCAILDGHGGYMAAQFLQEKLLAKIQERMPDPVSSLPPRDSPQRGPFLFRLRAALCSALMSCEHDFAQLGLRSGATVSIIMITADVVTVACLGDSTVWMDTGAEIMRLTPDHGPGVNDAEHRRLLARGVWLARLHQSMTRPAEPHEQGFGPLRIYPGGLALSRAFGDIAHDIDASVLSAPHITQVGLPPGGVRLLIASDGVWNAWKDLEDTSSFIRGLRKQDHRQAVNTCMTETCYATGLKDDTTMAIIDVLGKDCPSFNHLVKALVAKHGKSNASYHGAPTAGLKSRTCLIMSETEIEYVVDYGCEDNKSVWAPRTPEDEALSSQLLHAKERCRALWQKTSPHAQSVAAAAQTRIAAVQQKELDGLCILEPSVHAPTISAYTPNALPPLPPVTATYGAHNKPAATPGYGLSGPVSVPVATTNSAATHPRHQTPPSSGGLPSRLSNMTRVNDGALSKSFEPPAMPLSPNTATEDDDEPIVLLADMHIGTPDERESGLAAAAAEPEPISSPIGAAGYKQAWASEKGQAAGGKENTTTVVLDPISKQPVCPVNIAAFATSK